MIKYSDEEGFIKSEEIRDKNDTRVEKVVLPQVAIGVFSIKLLESMVEKFNCEKVGYFGGATFHRPVYIMKHNNKEFTLFNAGVSGAWISSDIEDLNYNGVKKFIIFGNCGVLDKNIDDCQIIIPNKAYRDEGVSYHYLPDSESIELSDKYRNKFIEILNKHSFKYVEGATWTIDAFYRETKEKIEYFRNKGAICVEMEGSVIAAVCKRKKLDYFTFYYAGDNLDSVEWEKRSISQETNFEKKQIVPLLAIELAQVID